MDSFIILPVTFVVESGSEFTTKSTKDTKKANLVDLIGVSAVDRMWSARTIIRLRQSRGYDRVSS